MFDRRGSLFGRNCVYRIDKGLWTGSDPDHCDRFQCERHKTREGRDLLAEYRQPGHPGTVAAVFRKEGRRISGQRSDSTVLLLCDAKPPDRFTSFANGPVHLSQPAQPPGPDFTEKSNRGSRLLAYSHGVVVAELGTSRPYNHWSSQAREQKTSHLFKDKHAQTRTSDRKFEGPSRVSRKSITRPWTAAHGPTIRYSIEAAGNDNRTTIHGG